MKNVATMPGVASTTFGARPAIDDAGEVIERDSEVAAHRKQPRLATATKSAAPRKSASRKSSPVTSVSMDQIVPSGSVDFTDPGQMADLAARFNSLNVSLLAASKEKIEQEATIKSMEQEIVALNKSLDEAASERDALINELNHANDKISLLRDSGIASRKVIKTVVIVAMVLTCVTLALYSAIPYR
ncbi:hypothetical protein D2T29_12180 [Sinirhodobacter populi]|uniref:Uncharacterized protein n=1 Tax=Paenirhodobacter populi TaxID=2306993 RepID=A0A443KCB0_9RHOB|nr:hypothetical protein [Sinirhodobacter populi]RWR30424.1 hypothetical protein D2T29_12180 [Sinirhodobacter populi]